jgi:glycosyltransferase involved in cell wall biosynthesis
MSETQIVKRKKKVMVQTDYVLARTGFGRNARAIFEYLQATGKYDLINFAVGSVDTQLTPDAARTPWKTIASVNAQNLENIKRQNDPRNWEGIERMAGYGAYDLNAAVCKEKPDVFFGIQDIWGVDFALQFPWFKKISSVIWTTLDSLPILPKAVEVAPNIKNYWCWADFATQALHKLGHQHVKTVRGAVDPKPFFRLSDQKRLALRKRFGISDQTFIVGYVFRNQLRKSVPNLIQGYKMFKQNNPKLLSRLLLHTCWVEGWDIPKLLQEHSIAQHEVLTTYVCRSCRNFQVKAFTNNEQDCPSCRASKQQCTTHPSIGITEEQLNEVYNLMDVYCHPFTSGGQEIPIQEAKLTELITLVTNYSCGEDMCVDNAGSLPLDWSEYREPGTQFIKASTYPNDICKQLNRVLNMKDSTRREMGKKARQWVLDNFSIQVIGKILEDFIDASPLIEDNVFEEKIIPKNPYAIVPEIADNLEWLFFLYRNILSRADINAADEGVRYWMERLGANVPRHEIEQFFRKTAFGENQKTENPHNNFENQLNKDDKGRVLVIQPESAGDIFLLTSLFKSIKERYPEWALYVATKREYKDVIDANPYVYKWLEYNPMMDNLLWLEGNNNHNGYFDIAYQPYFQTQKMFSYTHNGKDKLDFSLQKL